MSAKGFALFEFIISVMIAMLAMMIILTIFQNFYQTSSHSFQDAEYDAKLQFGLLIAQKILQNAGYGSGSSQDIAIGSYQEQPAIFWRFINQTANSQRYECQGLTEEIIPQGTQFVHHLVLLTNPNCDATKTITHGQWQEQKSIAMLKNRDDTPIFHYDLRPSQCMPKGLNADHTPQPSIRQLTLTALRPHVVGIHSNIKTVICLNNIKLI